MSHLSLPAAESYPAHSRVATSGAAVSTTPSRLVHHSNGNECLATRVASLQRCRRFLPLRNAGSPLGGGPVGV